MNPVVTAGVVLIGALFAVKMAYVISTAAALKRTRGALFVASAPARVDAFLDRAPLGPGTVLYDLGCGDGRVIRAAARRDAVAVGFETNLFPFVLAKLRTMGQPLADVRWADFHRVDLSRADVVFCYLFPDALKDLAPKLDREIKPGAWVCSSHFPLPGRTADRIFRPAAGRNSDPIYMYRWPDRGSPDQF